MLNEKKIIMTSYFHNGALFHFFEFLTTLARYSAAKILKSPKKPSRVKQKKQNNDVTKNIIKIKIFSPKM